MPSQYPRRARLRMAGPHSALPTSLEFFRMDRRTKNILFIMCDQLRFDYLVLHRPSPPEDTEHRRAGGARRALHPRLCAVAGLRRLAHELLYRPLRAFPRRVVERLSAQGRRDDASAIICVRSGSPPCWSARPTCSRTREGMERLGIDPQSIIGVRVSECGFDPYDRDDGTACVRTGRPLRPAHAPLQCLPQRQGLCGRQSLARLRQCRGRRGQCACVWLGDAPRAQARARRGGGFRDALHDAARDGVHGRGRRSAMVPASVLHQAALALYRARALQRHVRPGRRDPGGEERS